MLILRRVLLVVGLCASSRVSNETFDGARAATPVLEFLRQRVANRAGLRSARALAAPFNLTEKVRAQRARPCALEGLGLVDAVVASEDGECRGSVTDL